MVDCLLIGLVFAAFASGLTPDVNEAHYLTKAKQFWQPNWLPQDLFLASSFPHWMFYVTFGWLTVVFDFVTAAWIGRIVGWLILAIGWEALASAFDLTRIAKITSAIVLIALVHVGNLSGEWVVGGIEAKIPAYALVFFALSRAVRDDWRWVWPVLGVAAGFHVLVGGWSFLACFVVRWAVGKDYRMSRFELGLILGGIVLAVGLGVLPSFISDLGADRETREMAARIYVRERIGHHLYFWEFSRTSILLFALQVIGWRELARESRDRRLSILNCFAALAVALTLAGICLSALADWVPFQSVANYMLRFYWFRLADIAVPMAISLGLNFRRHETWQPSGGQITRSAFSKSLGGFRLLNLILVLGSLAVCSVSVAERWRDGRPGADRQSLPSYADNPIRTRETQANWVKTCRWIKENTRQDAVFLTPRNQQTFTWYSDRCEYANWKNIPQNANAIREWERRMTHIYGKDWGESLLPYLTGAYRSEWLEATGAKYVVIEQRTWHEMESAGDISSLVAIYPTNPAQLTTYTVLEIRLPVAQQGAEDPAD